VIESKLDLQEQKMNERLVWNASIEGTQLPSEQNVRNWPICEPGIRKLLSKASFPLHFKLTFLTNIIKINLRQKK
jgi:hypothetical protein